MDHNNKKIKEINWPTALRAALNWASYFFYIFLTLWSIAWRPREAYNLAHIFYFLFIEGTYNGRDCWPPGVSPYLSAFEWPCDL